MQKKMAPREIVARVDVSFSTGRRKSAGVPGWRNGRHAGDVVAHGAVNARRTNLLPGGFANLLRMAEKMVKQVNELLLARRCAG